MTDELDPLDQSKPKENSQDEPTPPGPTKTSSEPVWQDTFETGIVYGGLIALVELVLYIIGAGAFGGWPFGPVFTLVGSMALFWVARKALVETSRSHFEELERRAREREAAG